MKNIFMVIWWCQLTSFWPFRLWFYVRQSWTRCCNVCTMYGLVFYQESSLWTVLFKFYSRGCGSMKDCMCLTNVRVQRIVIKTSKHKGFKSYFSSLFPLFFIAEEPDPCGQIGKRPVAEFLNIGSNVRLDQQRREVDPGTRQMGQTHWICLVVHQLRRRPGQRMAFSSSRLSQWRR